jgi:SAM-dependent methyltransferase
MPSFVQAMPPASYQQCWRCWESRSAKLMQSMSAPAPASGPGCWPRNTSHSVTAIEPSDEMRRHGSQTAPELGIVWRRGKAEETGLPSGSCDLVSMASSFHWTDFDKACAEFQRILRPGGRFVALWNPRMVELNPLLVEIEQEITRLNPDVKRVSSGRSGLTEKLTGMLWAKPGFDDVVYLEARHVANQTVDQYKGAWRSVNDLRVQLGRIGSPGLWISWSARPRVSRQSRPPI